jgi:2-C-methyl-D-erythritol 2,4-cyclodiphosphate synthase
MMERRYRIGYGYDVHRLAPGLPLMLGGVEVTREFGCVAHSDGDVLLHAICDALLGAAALGDIGRHFPDSDPAFRGISSLKLLELTAGLLGSGGWEICNIDSTVILEKPRIAGHVEEMRCHISGILSLRPGDISVKATTSEGLGFVGAGSGIAAHATALLRGF